MPRVVFDCVVFVQALANAKGPAHACLELVRSGKLDLFLSHDVVTEVREVLNRPKLQRKLPALTPDRVQAFLEDVVHLANVVADVPARFPFPRDPKDEPYLNLAIVARAHYLVSRDKDILDLANDEDFRDRLPDLIVLDPVRMLKEMAPAPIEVDPSSEDPGE